MHRVKSFRGLIVYQRAFQFQQEVFRVSTKWAKVEDYALTDQIRRSSRSIGANLAESWAKRRYPAHFLSKLTDADGEAQETLHWIDTALACSYITPAKHQELTSILEEIGKMLGSMIAQSKSFCLTED